MIKKLIFVAILGVLAGNLFSQEVLPYSTDKILIFIEPFEDQGPDHSQSWLNKGLPGFLKTSLSETDNVYPYLIPDFDASLIDRPHRLQDMIWKSVFKREIDPAYESYLILGSYSYLEGQISIRMELLSLKSTRRIARFEQTLGYTKLLSWKEALGDWILAQLNLIDEPGISYSDEKTLDNGVAPMPGVPIKDQMYEIFNQKQRKETEDLQRKYEQQSMMKLGTQLEALWHDIAYDPYLAEIFDIHTLRLQYEPDSVLVNFKVSYRINPRILDEIEHFSRTRSGHVEKTESFEEHSFMDLGYIDADFTKQIAGGDWRIVPIITMGMDSSPGKRVFYHSFPRPIESPGEHYYNQGEFKQLLMAIPGVDALRIFAQEVQQVYEYSIVVGYDEIKQLDKIQVKFVAEEDLAKKL
ncbi:MAG: hypothetical protein K9N35_07190 [Candidatus Marinimicrobia bacterium]|nr:hypothetical protein [Candidatus Neomarinimicrobiota bacterium]